MLKYQSVVAGPSRAPVQSPEPSQSDTVTHDREGSEELAQDEDTGLAPRDWTVVQICARRDNMLPNVDEYQVRWARTRHPTAQFRISTRRGRLRVKVAGRPWGIVSHVEASPNGQNGEPETVVEWANTWHTMWELTSAFAAIADFERQNPRPARQLTLGTKPDLRDWPLYLESFEDPEPEPGLEAEDSNDRITGFVFEIEEGFDYTASFLHHCKRKLRNSGKLVSPVIATLMCMPQRQRLKFNPDYVRANDTFGGRVKNWRILPVYIAGLAHRRPCTNCANAAPETLLFELCVNWEGVYAGACVNCAYAGSRLSSTCDCRRGPWTWKQNARQIQLPEVRSDVGDEESTYSRDYGRRSGGFESSVDLDEVEEGFTPPSEPSPENARKEGEESNPASRQESDEGATHGATGLLLASGSIIISPVETGDTHIHGSSYHDNEVALDMYNASPDVQSSLTSISRPVLDPRSALVVQDMGHANEQAVQSTNGMFGVWSPADSSHDNVQALLMAGPSRRSSRNLTSRQLSKRPVVVNTKTINGSFSQPKRARRSMRDSEYVWEDAADPPETFKFEPTPSQPTAERLPEYDVSHHIQCPKHPRGRCVDPTVGFRLASYDKYHPPAGVVYAHENNWEAGGLADDNVMFIISHCPCTKTEYLNDAWKQMVHAKPSNRNLSKYTVMSHRYYDKLNLLIRAYCPSRPQMPGEVIELD